MTITAEQQSALRAPFPAEEIGKLPRITCKDCRETRGSKVCSKHSKARCPGCGNYITGQHIHFDYVGHAELTDRLLAVDPEWTWEPAAWTETGEPVVTKHEGNLVMWGRLTLCGVTRLGVGTAEAGKADAHKELIGDFLRNAGMRFGVALDLWRKSEKAEAEAVEEEDHGPAYISAENAAKLRQRCVDSGLDVAEVVKKATDGRTEDPEEVLRGEVTTVKRVIDEMVGAPL